MTFVSFVAEIKITIVLKVWKTWGRFWYLKISCEDRKSCIVIFCYCYFTGAFKGLRANLLPSSYFSMNLLVRAGKIVFKRREEPSQKVKQASIPGAGYEEHHKFPKWHWGKVSKIGRSRMFPCPIFRKKQFAGHVRE